jgi:hypothetical protein
LSLDFKVNCWFFVIGSLFNPFCCHFSCALRTCVIYSIQPNWRYVWWSIQCQMPKSPIIRKDLSLYIKVNCWSFVIESLSNPFCYYFSCAFVMSFVMLRSFVCSTKLKVFVLVYPMSNARKPNFAKIDCCKCE